MDAKTIFTSQMVSWKVVALMTGLGFEHYRDEHGDQFTSKEPVEILYDGWEPTKNGADRIQNWDELSDPESLNYRRKCIKAFAFQTPGGFSDVIVWETSPHDWEQMYYPVALLGRRDWDNNKDDDGMLKSILTRNAISLK